MPAVVTKFPGNRCRHYISGKCLLEEHLNPGLHQQWRCVAILRMEKEWDGFLTRAEAFELEDSVASSIWSKRMDGLSAGFKGCPSYRSGAVVGEEDSEPFIDCVHALSEVCLLALPECGGVCAKYEPGDRDAEES